MSDVMYRQCKLNRQSPNGGLIEYVAWIPSKFAVTGKRIIVNDVEWDVEYDSSIEMSSDYIHDTHKLEKILPSLQKNKKKK